MTNKFALPVFAVIAILGAFTMSAFSKKSAEMLSPNEPKLVNTYFQFMGAPGQEDDETKWSQITPAEYSDLSCPGNADGCALITSTTQTIGSVLRPQLVEVNIVNGHKNPKTTGGVSQVRLKTLIPQP